MISFLNPQEKTPVQVVVTAERRSPSSVAITANIANSQEKQDLLFINGEGVVQFRGLFGPIAEAFGIESGKTLSISKVEI